MTVIAIVKNRQGKLMIGADRRDSSGWHYAQTMETPKISKKKGILFGATGSSDLCSLFVEEDAFEVPDRKVTSVNKYMYHIFKPAVVDFLSKQGYALKEKDKSTAIIMPPGDGCEVVIGIDGQVWVLILQNILDDSNDGHLSLFRASSPYSTGCGGQGTPDGIFKYILKTKGYISEKDLKATLEIVAEIAPGCDGIIDVLKED